MGQLPDMNYSTKMAKAIDAWFDQNKYIKFDQPEQFNIVYVEGMNPDFTLNYDKLDGWNDLRIIIEYSNSGKPEVIFCAIATTEPGRASTLSPDAAKKGGVARVAFRQYMNKWVLGYHNYPKTKTAHPALVQKSGEVIMVHRDVDKNGIRTGDPLSPAKGINQHSTMPGAKPELVGKWSAGCLVGMVWEEHIEFLYILKHDNRCIKYPGFAFSSTIIPGDKLITFAKNERII